MEHLGSEKIYLSDIFINKLYLNNNEDIYIADIKKLYPKICENITTKHTHDFYYLAWIEKGGFKYYADINEYEVSDNSILLLSPGEIHSFENISGISGYAIHFTESFYQNINSEWTDYIKNEILKGIPILQISDDPTAYKIKAIIEEMVDIYQNKQATMSSSACMCSLLTLLLFTIGETKEHKEFKKEEQLYERPYHSLYLSFTKEVESNFRKHYTVEYYAKKMNVSMSTLNVCCKANAAMTPSDIINNRIMQEAKRLLLYTDLRSSEISHKLGFSEQSHFINFFRKFMNMPPTRYRKINKNKH